MRASAMSMSFSQKSDSHSLKFLKKQSGGASGFLKNTLGQKKFKKTTEESPGKTKEAQKTIQNMFTGLRAKLEKNKQKLEENKEKAVEKKTVSKKAITLADIRKRNKTFVSSGTRKKKKKNNG